MQQALLEADGAGKKLAKGQVAKRPPAAESDAAAEPSNLEGEPEGDAAAEEGEEEEPREKDEAVEDVE